MAARYSRERASYHAFLARASRTGVYGEQGSRVRLAWLCSGHAHRSLVRGRSAVGLDQLAPRPERVAGPTWPHAVAAASSSVRSVPPVRRSAGWRGRWRRGRVAQAGAAAAGRSPLPCRATDDREGAAERVPVGGQRDREARGLALLVVDERAAQGAALNRAGQGPRVAGLPFHTPLTLAPLCVKHQKLPSGAELTHVPLQVFGSWPDVEGTRASPAASALSAASSTTDAILLRLAPPWVGFTSLTPPFRPQRRGRPD